MYKHILVATDGSELGQKGLEHGLSLARDQGARITIVTVTEPYPLYAGDAFGVVTSGAVVADYGSIQLPSGIPKTPAWRQTTSS